MFKPYLRPPILLVLIYSAFTFLCLLASLSMVNETQGMIAFLPLMPWSILSFAVPYTSMFFFFGYFVIFTINALLIYYIANKNSKPIRSIKSPYYLAVSLAVGYLSWAILIVNYALTCTEKLCGLVAIFAVFPMSFLFTLADNYDYSEAGWMYIAVALNAFILFWIGWHVERRHDKNSKSF